jgi:hypothetical protein
MGSEGRLKGEAGMDQENRFVRERTYYDEYPDYTRPALEVPPTFRERVRARLELLYGHKGTEKWMTEIERTLKVHHAHKPPEMIEKEKKYDPAKRFWRLHKGSRALFFPRFCQGKN